MSQLSCRRRARPGNIAPLAAVLSIILLGMVAFSVDMTWIVVTKSELQNAADSAALAGSGQLMTNYALYNLPNQSANQQQSLITGAISAAKTAAKNYASYNNAGGVKGLTLLDSDIQVGFVDQNGKFTVSTFSGPYPNTVKVFMRRDASANQSLKLFFAPVLGTSTMDVTAAASATCYSGSINSFSASGSNIAMLPMTYDVNFWKNFLQTGQDPDGNTSIDRSGNPTLQVYPSNKATGNFGELSLNDGHNGASTTASWIANGMSSDDLQALLDANLLPLSQHKPNTWDWQGNPGFKANNVMDVNANIGQVYYLPLFQPVNSNLSSYQAGTGQGSNYSYDIVQFVPVQIMTPPSNNKQVVVQPASVVAGPNVIFDPATIAPMGTSSYSTTFTAPKLSN
jgi:Flp pilus assembly protein TadG